MFNYGGIKTTRIYGNENIAVAQNSATVMDYGPDFVDMRLQNIALGDYTPATNSMLFELVLDTFDVSNPYAINYQFCQYPDPNNASNYIVDIIKKTDTPGQLEGYTIIVENNQVIGIRDCM